MRTRIHAFIEKQSKLPLEQRIFNVILFFSIITAALCGIIDFFVATEFILRLIAIIGCITALIFIYYISTKKYSITVFLGLLIFIFIIIPVIWIINGGTMGILPYFIIASSAGIALLLSGPGRIIYISCLIAMTCALTGLEYNYPLLIRGFASDTERYIIISSGLLITISYNALLFVVILNNYKNERRKADEYLLQLKTANEQLQQEITERKQIEQSLRESEDKYRTIFRTSSTALVIIEEDTTISLANEEFEEICGYTKSEIEGNLSWKQFILPEDVGRIIGYHYSRRDGHSSVPKSYEIRFVNRSGKIKDTLLSVSMIPGTRKSVASVVDISNIKQTEAQLKYLATHDHLTGLPNRYSFEESLKRAITKAKNGKKSALLVIDIDNFKIVNDTKGHTAGDTLLVSVSNTIRENLRESDTIARLGGDEFGVLLEEAAVDEARHFADKLRQIAEEREFCLLKYGCFNLSLSIGVVLIDGALNSQELLSHADTALYLAKEKGRNRVVLSDTGAETSSRFEEINRSISLIKNAVREDYFELHFQPVVRLSTAEIIHYEALVRLREETGELIPPQTFIPVAEQFGLMPLIDRWVVSASLDILRLHPDLNLFINISGISLSEESLLDYIEEMLTKAGLEPHRLGFEITETAVIKDMQIARRWIERLKKSGCQFALDDFGKGFSSFSYLHMLPVDYLKIDGSFIRNIDKDPAQRALVKAMSTVARSLGKMTVAEYVETAKAVEILQELKIDCAQGYFYGKPAPID